MYVQLYVQSSLKCGSVWTKGNRKRETEKVKQSRKIVNLSRDPSPLFCAATDMITYSQYTTLY